MSVGDFLQDEDETPLESSLRAVHRSISAENTFLKHSLAELQMEISLLRNDLRDLRPMISDMQHIDQKRKREKAQRKREEKLLTQKKGVVQ